MKAINVYAGHRYPKDIISHVVWLYHRYTLSFRDIEDNLAYNGIQVSYESIRQWCLKFGKRYANNQAENSHQRTRQQERQMRAKNYRMFRERAFYEWTEVSCA